MVGQLQHTKEDIWSVKSHFYDAFITLHMLPVDCIAMKSLIQLLMSLLVTEIIQLEEKQVIQTIFIRLVVSGLGPATVAE